jgi:hypothetical protein
MIGYVVFPLFPLFLADQILHRVYARFTGLSMPTNNRLGGKMLQLILQLIILLNLSKILAMTLSMIA